MKSLDCHILHIYKKQHCVSLQQQSYIGQPCSLSRCGPSLGIQDKDDEINPSKIKAK